MLPDFSRSERKALLVGTVLVIAGAAARIGLGPDEASWAWSPADSVEGGSGALAEVRSAVSRSRRRAARIATPLAPDERLDPNRAPDVELQRLSGVGPVLARAIVEHRRRTPFRRKDDLLAVKGIGPATLERMAPHLDLPDAPSGGGTRPGPASPGPRVDVNRAGRAELERLPGVGPVLAKRIVDRRRRKGRFAHVDELAEVAGIGPARLRELRPLVSVR